MSNESTKTLGATELKRLHRSWRRETSIELALVLDGVQKPYNVGGLFRSAAAYGVRHVWSVPPTPEASERSVAKIALGSERLVATHRSPSGPIAVAEAQELGFFCVAIELTSKAVPLFRLDLTGTTKICLVLGHEERGVHRETLSAVDACAYLPQIGKIGSLNVAQAGTTALYEVLRQHWQA